MDGSPSAPDSGPESLEITEGPSRPSEIERELNELRARAYGPEADIDADPAAMARLIELEAAQGTVATTVHDTPHVVATATEVSGAATPAALRLTPDPPTQPAKSVGMRRRTGWFIAGAVVLVVILASGVTWLLGPRADATLQSTEFDPSSGIIELLEGQGRNPDPSTVRQFEPYHGVDLWAVESVEGDVCLIVWDSERSGRFGIQCVPPSIDAAYFMGVGPPARDGFGEWLPEGSVISYHLRENTVEVFVRPPPAD